MTVTENFSPKVQYIGKYEVDMHLPIVFPFHNPSDVKCQKNFDPLTYNVDYKVVDQDVVLLIETSESDKITIYRNTPFDQQAEFPQNNTFDSAKINEQLDKICMQQQEQEERLSRAIVADVSLMDFNGKLPPPKGDNVIKWNPLGTALENYDIIGENNKFKAEINQTVSDFKDDVEDRLDTFEATTNAKISANKANTDAQIAANKADTDEQIEDFTTSITNSFDTLSSNINTQITVNKADTDTQIAANKADTDMQIAALNSKVTNDINSFKTVVTGDIADFKEEVTEQITANKEEIETKFDEFTAEVDAKIEDVSEAAEIVKGLGDAVQTAIDASNTAIEKANEVADAVDEAKDAANKANAAIAELEEDKATITAAVAEVVSKGEEAVTNITTTGDTYVTNITNLGDQYSSDITTMGDGYKTDITTIGDQYLSDIGDEGDDQIARIIAEGNTQVERVETTGDTQNTRVLTQGNTQDARVIAEGDTQVARLQAEGAQQVLNIQQTGIYVEGDKLYYTTENGEVKEFKGGGGGGGVMNYGMSLYSPVDPKNPGLLKSQGQRNSKDIYPGVWENYVVTEERKKLEFIGDCKSLNQVTFEGSVEYVTKSFSFDKSNTSLKSGYIKSVDPIIITGDSTTGSGKYSAETRFQYKIRFKTLTATEKQNILNEHNGAYSSSDILNLFEMSYKETGKGLIAVNYWTTSNALDVKLLGDQDIGTFPYYTTTVSNLKDNTYYELVLDCMFSNEYDSGWTYPIINILPKLYELQYGLWMNSTNLTNLFNNATNYGVVTYKCDEEFMSSYNITIDDFVNYFFNKEMQIQIGDNNPLHTNKVSNLYWGLYHSEEIDPFEDVEYPAWTWAGGFYLDGVEILKPTGTIDTDSWAYHYYSYDYTDIHFNQNLPEKELALLKTVDDETATEYDWKFDFETGEFILPTLNGSEDLPGDQKIQVFYTTDKEFILNDYYPPKNGYVSIYDATISSTVAIYNPDTTRGINTSANIYSGSASIFAKRNEHIQYSRNLLNAATQTWLFFIPAVGNGDLYFYVGDSVKQTGTIDIDAFVEGLANKADTTKVNELTTEVNKLKKAYITETYQNGTSWYRVYSDGWCEQGGNVAVGSVNAGQSKAGIITFLKPCNVLEALSTPTITNTVASTANGGSHNCTLYELTNTYTKYTVANRNGSAAATFRLDWQVKGYLI